MGDSGLMPRILSVSELTAAVRDAVETEFPFVWVAGQATNVSRPGSGHIYFSLKDEDALLQAVWFKSCLGLPGSMAPEDLTQGVEVVCAGRVTVYPPRGVYQLVVEFVQERGVSPLYLEFSRLKEKLEKEGLFDPSRKRSVLQDAARVAVVTAPGGAAVHDFLRVARERGVGGTIRIYGTSVQGENAQDEIIRAMARAGEWAEVVVLLRGGGSPEDLHAFNTEAVVRATAACPCPVVTGVGHETDVTIADFAADLRAATPTHAAQLLFSDRLVAQQRLDELRWRLLRRTRTGLEEREQAFRTVEREMTLLSPMQRLRGTAEQLRFHDMRLREAARTVFSEKERDWEFLERRLDARHPAERLGRAKGDVDATGERMTRAAGRLVSTGRHAWDLLDTRLRAANPFAPLERGYSLVETAVGTYLRTPSQVRPGDDVTIRTAGGAVPARIAEAKECKG